MDMLERVEDSFRNRLQQCIENGGRHLNFTDALFKTGKRFTMFFDDSQDRKHLKTLTLWIRMQLVAEANEIKEHLLK